VGEVGEKTRQNQGLILSKVLKKRGKSLRCHSYSTPGVGYLVLRPHFRGKFAGLRCHDKLFNSGG